MDAHMSAQIRPLSEELLALWTLIWLLICVHSEVGHKIPRLREDLVAVIVFANVQPFVDATFFVRVVNDLVLMPFQDFVIDHISLGRISKIISRTFRFLSLAQEILILVLSAKIKLARSCMLLSSSNGRLGWSKRTGKGLIWP